MTETQRYKSPSKYRFQYRPMSIKFMMYSLLSDGENVLADQLATAIQQASREAPGNEIPLSSITRAFNEAVEFGVLRKRVNRFGRPTGEVQLTGLGHWWFRFTLSQMGKASPEQLTTHRINMMREVEKGLSPPDPSDEDATPAESDEDDNSTDEYEDGYDEEDES